MRRAGEFNPESRDAIPIPRCEPRCLSTTTCEGCVAWGFHMWSLGVQMTWVVEKNRDPMTIRSRPITPARRGGDHA